MWFIMIVTAHKSNRGQRKILLGIHMEEIESRIVGLCGHSACYECGLKHSCVVRREENLSASDGESPESAGCGGLWDLRHSLVEFIVTTSYSVIDILNALHLRALIHKLLSTPHLCDAMRLSSHRIVCACLFLVTSLLVTVVAGPLIAKRGDQLEHQTPHVKRYDQVIRIGFQKPGSETYESIDQNSPHDFSGLQLTIFFDSTGFQPRIVTHKDNNTTELEIKIVKAPREERRPEKMDQRRMLKLGPDSAQSAFKIMTNVEQLKDETNELLQTRVGVKADDEFTQVHDIKDDLDYINTCLLFLTLFHNTAGEPMLWAGQLNDWHDLYSRLNRRRGVYISEYEDGGTNA
ncbi:hypothetical protein F5890DRAFT_1475023 [Lentinula detonsa]|uniref:Uncharacterized protein n=1 Tax=Lentinula detonsa TaxID=2804962 RepID=A0AA38PY17_9AGAR|nr:hypothetical protein F5890DRAFT_1475023 [Lentinula detonsa]